MPDTLSTRPGSSDAELISAVRSGDTETYGELFDRHRDAATRLAGQLVRGPDADDLVAEAFIRVLGVLQAGKGPDESFRAYLLTAVRRLHIDRIRASRRVRSTGDDFELDRAVEFVDPAEMKFEHRAAADAFSSLPERWQLVLWHLDVEGQKPAAVAPLLGLSPNSVSALAYRAREGLRQAYLQGHLAPHQGESCRKATGMLGAYVRKGLSSRDTAVVESHLHTCSRCMGLQLELAEVNSNLSGVLAPALLGTAATGYVTGAAAATVTAGIGASIGANSAVGFAIEAVLTPVKVLGTVAVGASTQGVVAVAVVASVATAGTVATKTDFGSTADERASSTSSPAAVSSSDPNPTDPAETDPKKPTPSETSPTEALPTEALPTEAVATPGVLTETAPAKPTPTDPVPTQDPIVPTDYSISGVAIANDDSFLQRRFTIPVVVATTGRSAAQSVTLRIDFFRNVVFRGVVSPQWSCGSAAPGSSLRSLTCTTTMPAGEGTTLITEVRGLRPAGTVTVSAADDPDTTNNSMSFASSTWLPL